MMFSLSLLLTLSRSSRCFPSTRAGSIRHHFAGSRHPGSSGFALITTLALVALLAILIVAFFSMLTSEMQVEASRANQIRAELLLRSSIVHVQSVILGDIKDPSRSSMVDVGGYRTYAPINNSDAVPERRLAPSVSHTDANFYNLLRQSVPGADASASGDSVTIPARNGRKLDSTRWNAPVLLSGNGFTTDGQLPNWIYIDKKNGISSTPTSDCIGRFAYNVYDLGGLLNPNVAGYPSTLTDEQLAQLKGGQGCADLTKLGAGLASADVNGLLAFRYPDNPTASDYVARMVGANATGYLEPYNEPAPGGSGNAHFLHNLFTSRQDLIRYARLKNVNFKNALPWLTHFSNSINAPSWRPPATPVNSNPDLLQMRFASAGTVTHYDDKGAVSTYTVAVGEPLVQRRFSLAKIAWLTPTGPASGISDQAIQAAFGLKWNATAERWDYVGPTGTTALEGIAALSNVAAEAQVREPNFFEILKAGILTGSLGAAAKGKSSTAASATNPTPMSMLSEQAADLDANKDLHILKIGANIIDCADADNYPTILALSFGGVAVERVGVEDLPYLYSLNLTNIRTSTKGTATPPSTSIPYTVSLSEFVWVPQLYNPHRVAATTPSQAPGSIRIDFSDGVLLQCGYGENTQLSPTISNTTLSKDLTALGSITVPSSAFETYRPTPLPIRDSGSSMRLGAKISTVDPTVADVSAFHIFSYKTTDEAPQAVPFVIGDGGSKMGVMQVSGMVMRLSYLTPGGKYKTYITLGGSEAFPDTTGIDGLHRDDFNFRAMKHSNSFANLANSNTATIPSIALVLADPRSNRFGPIMNRYTYPLAEGPHVVTSATSGETLATPQPFLPNIYLTGSTTTTRTGVMLNLPQIAAFEDPDFTSALGPRPPDGYLNKVAPVPSAANSSNPYAKAPSPATGVITAPRPVILQRPYRTVAELGYVSRDMPWQTLSFWNNRSADAALLDLFSVHDEPALTASRVALTTRHLQVLKALMSRTPQMNDSTMLLTDTQTDSLAAQVLAVNYSGGDPVSTMMLNGADVASLMSTTTMTSTLSAIPIKYRRESVARALSWSQNRTWNVMADIVAQTGRFAPGTPPSPSNFILEGETRMWSSMAIDRYTGKTVAQQNEKVYE